MTRGDNRGFALVAVLWLVALLATAISVELASITTLREAAHNRILLTRARWAALGCVALVQVGGESTTNASFGEGVSCVTVPENPDEQINLNVPDSAGWMRVLGDSIAVASLLDWIDPDDVPRAGGAESEWYLSHRRVTPRNGPLESDLEVLDIRGFNDTTTDLLALLTIRGDGRVAPNRAPRDVLRTLSVLPQPAIDRWITAREGAGGAGGPEEFTVRLGLTPTVSDFQEIVRRTTFTDSRRTVRVVATAAGGGRSLEFELLVDLVEGNGRLRVAAVEGR